jgi:hypothetical protein
MVKTKSPSKTSRVSNSKAVVADPLKNNTGTSDAVNDTPSAGPAVTLGKAVQIYLKSSSHSISLADPKVVALGAASFVEGTQVTGKVGHRLEGKRTLVACDNIASMVEFASEDDIWSEPQSKLLRHTRVEEDPSPVLTLHEQGQSVQPRPGGHFGGDRPHFDRQHRDGQHRDRQHHGKHRHRGHNRGDRG